MKLIVKLLKKKLLNCKKSFILFLLFERKPVDSNKFDVIANCCCTNNLLFSISRCVHRFIHTQLRLH